MPNPNLMPFDPVTGEVIEQAGQEKTASPKTEKGGSKKTADPILAAVKGWAAGRDPGRGSRIASSPLQRDGFRMPRRSSHEERSGGRERWVGWS